MANERAEDKIVPAYGEGGEEAAAMDRAAAGQTPQKPSVAPGTTRGTTETDVSKNIADATARAKT